MKLDSKGANINIISVINLSILRTEFNFLYTYIKTNHDILGICFVFYQKFMLRVFRYILLMAPNKALGPNEKYMLWKHIGINMLYMAHFFLFIIKVHAIVFVRKKSDITYVQET